MKARKFMNNIDLMNYWIKSSDNDYDVMLDLKEKKRNIIVGETRLKRC